MLTLHRETSVSFAESSVGLRPEKYATRYGTDRQRQEHMLNVPSQDAINGGNGSSVRTRQDCFSLDFLMVLYYLEVQEKERDCTGHYEYILSSEQIDKLGTAHNMSDQQRANPS
jgi:hypothetical protein